MILRFVIDPPPISTFAAAGFVGGLPVEELADEIALRVEDAWLLRVSGGFEPAEIVSTVFEFSPGCRITSLDRVAEQVGARARCCTARLLNEHAGEPTGGTFTTL